MPELLRGYVELVHDASHQPSARYIESLLYRSPYYDLSLQSIAFGVLEEDHRAPQFTIPPLEDDPLLGLPAKDIAALDETSQSDWVVCASVPPTLG